MKTTKHTSECNELFTMFLKGEPRECVCLDILKKKIKAIYDRRQAVDRYTVYFSDRKAWGISTPKIYPCVCMSADPFHPQGVGQHSSGMLGQHNGRKIKFEELPEDCQRLVIQDLQD